MADMTVTQEQCHHLSHRRTYIYIYIYIYTYGQRRCEEDIFYFSLRSESVLFIRSLFLSYQIILILIYKFNNMMSCRQSHCHVYDFWDYEMVV